MKKIMTIAISVLLCFAFAASAMASGEGAAALYNQGNALFAKGDFEGAAHSYEYALEQGAADPRLEQNIGSAYFKMGDLGRAIYHFERGLMLSPRDRDLQYNLALARQMMTDELPQNGNFAANLINGFVESFTTGEFVAALAVLFSFLCLFVLLAIIVQRSGKTAFIWIAAAFALLLVALSPFAAMSYSRGHFIDRAIVISSEAVARTGPGPELSEAFTVHAGMPCVVHERRAGYAKVTIETGLSGWIEQGGIRILAFDEKSR